MSTDASHPRPDNQATIDALTARLTEAERNFRVLADAMPQMVWATQPDGYHDYFNARWYEFTGTSPGATDGAGWADMFHPQDRERAWTLWRRSLETGQDYEIEYRLRAADGTYRWVLGRASPVRGEDGRIVRWFGTCTDIDDLKRSEEARALLSQELSHRIKNIFAVIGALVALSARQFPEAKAFAAALRTRIAALARAHEFVRPHADEGRPRLSTGCLHAFLRELLRAYSDGDDQRVTISGADSAFDDQAATPLALLFHELATNAAKYGALSAEGGQVAIEGRLDGDQFELTWRETGGPPIEAPPTGEGFGANLARLSVEGQLGGLLEKTWRREGLEVRVRLPASALARRRRLAGDGT